MNMEKFEKLLFQSDFSKKSDFKDELRKKLFAGQSNVVSMGGTRLSDDELDFVNAAGTAQVDRALDKEHGCIKMTDSI